MKTILKTAIVSLTLISLTRCGVDQPAPQPIVRHQKIVAKLLVAPWCTVCANEIQDLSKHTDYDRAHIIITGVMQTDMDPNKPPTDFTASIMTEENLPVIADKKIWGTYKEYFPDETSFTLPRVVLFGEDEVCDKTKCKIVDTFITAMKPPYTVDDILSVAKSSMQPVVVPVL